MNTAQASMFASAILWIQSSAFRLNPQADKTEKGFLPEQHVLQIT